MDTTYNAMPSKSTLELMLEKMQELENGEQCGGRFVGALPPLPARPVSRARLPSPAKRGVQQSPKLKNKASSTFMREAVVSSAQQLIQTNGFDDTSTEEATIRGVLILQRCYRGYRARCYVNELKRSVITLQSLIRAEMSRKAYHHLAESLSINNEMLRQNVQDVQSHLLRGQHGDIILLQSRIRGWLTRRHYKHIRNSVDPVEKSQDQTRSKPELMDHIRIPYSIVFELQRQVLKTEAALQERKEQNAALRNNLKQFEERFLQYEDKMKSMEKMWQEQLTSIQVSLADAAKKKVAAKRAMTKLPELLQDESPLNIRDNSATHQINHQNGELDDNDDGNYFQVKVGSWVSKKDVIGELQKLESQYGAWEKEYSMRLEETKATMKKFSLPQKEKNQKRWWRRPLRN